MSKRIQFDDDRIDPGSFGLSVMMVDYHPANLGDVVARGSHFGCSYSSLLSKLAPMRLLPFAAT